MLSIRTDQNSLTKRQNRARMLQLIMQHGPLTRLEIHRRTGLSRASVSTFATELLTHGLLTESRDDGQTKRPGAGRIPELLAINPAVAGVVGVNIVKAQLTVGYVNLVGHVEKAYKRRISDITDVTGVIDMARSLSLQLLQWAKENGKHVFGLGISMPGIIDANRRRVLYSGLDAAWKGIDLAGALQLQKIPVSVDRDVRAMTLAEHTFGIGRDHQNLALVFVDRVVGCGLVLNGQIYRGSDQKAGELGKLPLLGQPGDLAEKIAIHRGAINALRSGAKSSLTEMADDSPEKITPADVARAAETDDPLAKKLVAELVTHLGHDLLVMAAFIDPSLIILCGGTIDASPAIVEQIQAQFNRASFFGRPAPLVAVSEFGPNVGVTGAAALALRDYVYSSRLALSSDLDEQSQQAEIVPMMARGQGVQEPGR